MHRIIEVKPLKDYKVWVNFIDGVEGTVDLLDLLVKGVFAAWKDPSIFESVFIDSNTQTIFWSGGIDLCPDSLYEEVLGVEIIS